MSNKVLDYDGLSYLWSKIKTQLTGKADATHDHSATQITSGTLSVARGGTGKSSVTSGVFLVGNGTDAMVEKTPAEVLQAIGAASVSDVQSKQNKLTGTQGQVVGFDGNGNAVAQDMTNGGGTTVIMAETEPSGLSQGDDWDMIMTDLEAPEDMFPYTVTLTSGTGYTLAAVAGSKSRVAEGGSYSFTIAIADDYQAGSGFAVKANGTALTAANGVYTITNITANQTVTVEGIAVIPATVTITGTGNTTYCYATINGTKRYGAASNIEVKPGDTITFGVYGRSSTYPGWVNINGSEALRVTNQSTQTYSWTVPAGTKTITMSMSYTSTSSQRRGQITVTTN